MNARCPECGTLFRVDPANVPDGGLRARCSVCGGIIPIASGHAWADDFADVTASSAPAAAVSSRGSTEGGSLPPPRPTPAPGDHGVPTIAELRTEPAHVAPAAQQTQVEPIGAAPLTEIMRPPAESPALVGRTSRPTPPRLPPFVPGRRSGSTAEGTRPVTETAVPAVAKAAGPASSPQSPAASTSTQQATPIAAVGSEAPPRRPINPFLANDPNAKARRLARALVSDMVAYHPQKREDGLRAGTLKQLFREEIRKSYEEYVEQIGSEVAESTSHFQDALNDVLAGGRKIF